jgi:hypothetical protein
MMNRGAGPITESSTETSITNTEIVTHLLSTAPCTITGNTGNMVRSLYRYGHLLILKLEHLLIVNAESAYQLEGPHAIPTTSNSLLLSNPQSLGRWLLRLYIAYYFIEERYPTWIHRLTGTNIVPDESSLDQGRLIVRPTNTRLMGYLIILHALGECVDACSRSCIRTWIDRFHFPVCHQNDPATAGDNNRQSRSSASSSSSIIDVPSNNRIACCAICRQERKHPACSVSCGHVFCWSCLQHWTRTRQECPMCRTRCRPQDILPLYNYSGP